MVSISILRNALSRGGSSATTWQNVHFKSFFSSPYPSSAGFPLLGLNHKEASIHTISHCNLECSEGIPSLLPNVSQKKCPPSSLYAFELRLRNRSTDFPLSFAYRGIVTSVKSSETKTTSPSAPTEIAAESVESEKSQKKVEMLKKVKEVEDSDYWGIVPKKYKRDDGSDWPWHSFRPSDAYAADLNVDLKKHFVPKTWGDWFAMYLVKSMRIPTDLFFRKRYGCRAMMLETVAAVPGMVAGLLLHLQSLRRFQHTGGWIRALLDEAENERMHLMTFMEVSKPAWYERLLVLTVQGIFFNAYFVVYLLSPKVAHRVVGYLEEEAVYSYTEFLKEIDAGRIENVPAPAIAIDYWRLPKDARLRDVVMVIRADEAHHRDVNHFASNVVTAGKQLKDNPAPVDYH